MPQLKPVLLFLSFTYACLFYSPLSMAETETEKACKLNGVIYLTNDKLFSEFNSTKSCSIIPENGAVAVFYPVAVERLQLLSWEFLTRLQAGKITRNTPKVLYYLGDLKDAFNAFNERGTGNRPYNKLYLEQATSNMKRIYDYLGQTYLTPPSQNSSARP